MLPLNITKQELEMISIFNLSPQDERTGNLIEELRDMGTLIGSDYLVEALRLVEERADIM